MVLKTNTAFALDAAQAARVDALFRDFDDSKAPGASVMVIHNGTPVFAKGYGLADLVTQTPCSPNTNFRLASVSKQFTAMAVLILAERGKLKLDERLTDFFPGFPAYGKQITVQQLLTHTSGLIEYEDILPPGTTIPEIWHGGDSIGFCTLIARLPEKGFTVVVLANRADAKLDDFSHRIADIVLFER
jgi:CubicO group peptidase (beta-lactamase class C family)